MRSSSITWHLWIRLISRFQLQKRNNGHSGFCVHSIVGSQVIILVFSSTTSLFLMHDSSRVPFRMSDVSQKGSSLNARTFSSKKAAKVTPSFHVSSLCFF